MTFPIDLYELLPAVHRREDAGLGYPLEALLDVVSTEIGHVQRNITDLWDDFFIETSAEWVVPYLADLVGATPLHDVAGSRRADVANTIAYRRRKGTRAMLEDLATDVTGWATRVVDFFELLQWSQQLDHVRREPGSQAGRSARVGTVDIGDADLLDRLDGPLDEVAHSVDVRPFGEGRGRHNLRKIGFFLWRLQSYPLRTDPRPAEGRPHGYHFSPLGNAAPLFTSSEGHVPPARRAEHNLPGPLRPLALRADLAAASRAFYGAGLDRGSVVVAVADAGDDLEVIAPGRVCVCDLTAWASPPAGKDLAIDPVLGRFTLAADTDPGAAGRIEVRYCYGFSGGSGGDLGGGPYDRRGSFDTPPEPVHRAAVARHPPEGVAVVSDRIDQAVEDWVGSGTHPRAVIEVLDSATYTIADDVIEVPEGASLELRAADGHRPVLDVGTLRVRGEGDARLVLNGFAIRGGPVEIGAGLASLVLRHCTLVPGRAFTVDGLHVTDPDRPSLTAAGDVVTCHVAVRHAIVGPVELPAEPFTVAIADSIVDGVEAPVAIGGPGNAPGPSCDLRRVTVMGDVHVRSLSYASEVIFDGAVTSERTQTGCVRFSWVPPGATTPARYRCQPDLAEERIPTISARLRTRARLRPRFTSARYGQPGYAQLAADAAPELKTGAANGSEMGAFNALRATHRETNLRLRLDEYLPAGLEAGLIHVT